MRWLSRPYRPALPRPRLRPWGRRLADERGAVAATVAIVLGTGVLLGMSAVVVDVGRLYAEREQLQSGADAAAWAIAETCVQEPASCANQVARARQYAGDNAADGAAGVSVICGRGAGLLTCPPAATNRTGCLGAAPASGNYAEVRTHTELPDGSTLVPPSFARAFAGDYAGTDVGACARVAWGPPRRATGMAVTFSTCEWNALTDNGTTFWPAPSSGLPAASAERVVYLKDNRSTTCDAGPSGWDRPGGFGWLDDPTSTCTTTVEADGTFGGNTGNSVSQPCKTALPALRSERRVTLIPIYDGVTGNGSHITYHLAGFASFVLTGYYLSGFTEPSWLSGTHHCSGSERCLYGYFTRGLVPTTGAEIGGPDLGVSIVNLVG
jgi:Flp pilus assembly protein TadG